jgi:nicotinate-nucleotide adenylyltransferase
MTDGAHGAAVGSAVPRYGVLGGTFDPPHLAHLAVAQEALVRLGLDRVYFVPTGQPPHKVGRAISPAADRRAMVELAIADNAGFALSTVDLDRAGPSYTAETLRRLRAEWGRAAEIALILGWDMLLDLPTWHAPAAVVAASTHIVALHRPGYTADPDQLNRLARALPDLPARLVLLPVPQLAISASDLRQRVALSLPIRYLVPDPVLRFISDHGLYRTSVPVVEARPAVREQPDAEGTAGPLPHDHETSEEARP